MSRARLTIAAQQLDKVRHFTKMFLADLAPEEWFWNPSELVTHIAWQVGHLACAQYSLCLKRMRGPSDVDESIISAAFMKPFGKDSVPQAGADGYPTPEEIVRVFDAVHARAIAELAERTDAELDVPVDPPHPAFATRLEAVEFSPCHEMVHAGQIGLLRRLMGKVPLR